MHLKMVVHGTYKYIIPLVVLLILITGTGACADQEPVPATGIIPQPQSLELSGEMFRINNATMLWYDKENTALESSASLFRSEILKYTDRKIRVAAKEGSGNRISLEIIRDHTIPAEGYRLSVNRSGIRISANEGSGIFYGLQSMLQLILSDESQHRYIPVPRMEVVDFPAFSWRGMHLDVSRHFYTVDSVKRYIDYLALYKFNRFHWHLTDDQGWRIEIKKYPKLTEVGAWRKVDNDLQFHGEKNRYKDSLYGGFYTQEEIREIVEYAAQRYITVVPEIELPGHAQAAIAAYPELGVTGKEQEVRTRWGISPVIYNPFEVTFDFLEDVFTEVLDLFPSKYIHIGGDEAIKDQWKESAEVQQLIRELGLADEHALQSWFIGRVGKFLEENGRVLIGWDEILEGGLPEGATVMSWRGVAGGIEAARQGHDVIMSPNTHLYLNFYQYENGPTNWAKRHVTNLGNVWSYDPYPQELDLEQRKYIIGAHGCIWTEHIQTFREVEYKLFPRIAALSEVVWSDRLNRDFAEFTGRLQHQVPMFDKLGVNYYKEELQREGDVME
ncbi:MAG: beta-N-acetylhexosaminidase [Bacteroidales bacterium]